MQTNEKGKDWLTQLMKDQQKQSRAKATTAQVELRGRTSKYYTAVLPELVELADRDPIGHGARR